MCIRDRARTGKQVWRLVNTHCHLDHTAGNIVFADVPIVAHDKTLAAMHANLGAKTGTYWTVSDYPTKIKMLFGQNLFDLVPENDPAQALSLIHISPAHRGLPGRRRSSRPDTSDARRRRAK